MPDFDRKPTLLMPGKADQHRQSLPYCSRDQSRSILKTKRNAVFNPSSQHRCANANHIWHRQALVTENNVPWTATKVSELGHQALCYGRACNLIRPAVSANRRTDSIPPSCFANEFTSRQWWRLVMAGDVGGATRPAHIPRF